MHSSLDILLVIHQKSKKKSEQMFVKLFLAREQIHKGLISHELPVLTL